LLGSRDLLEDASVDVETWLLTKANRSMRSVVSDAVIAGKSFRTSVEKVRVPTLRRGDIVIMDNLGSHKGKAVRALITVGAKLFFLPKYSPDLNPIGQVFAKLKHFLRKAAARTTETICAAIGESEPSPRRNAPTTSKTQAGDQPKFITL